MALDVKLGTFNTPTATGNQATTGIGFQPKVVLFFSALAGTGDPATATSQGRSLRGAGASSSEQFVATITIDGDDETGVSWFSASNCIAVLASTGSTSPSHKAALVSLDADGFTLDWTATTATQHRIVYVALGGDDLSNVEVGTFQSPADSSGVIPNQTVTISPSFQPTALLLATGNSTSLDAIGRGLAWGTASGATNRNFSAASFFSSAVSYTGDDALLLVDNAEEANGRTKADLVSFNSDGFTLSYTTTAGTYQRMHVGYVALRGPRFKSGASQQPTTAGSQATTNVGFQPTVLLTHGVGSSTKNGDSIAASLCIGAGVTSSNRHAAAVRAQAFVGTGSRQTSSRIVTMETAGGGVLADADLVSLDSDGFTLNWITADATQRWVFWFAIAGQATAQEAFPSPVESGEAHGSPAAAYVALAGAVASGEAVGGVAALPVADLASVSSGELTGLPAAAIIVLPAWTGSAEAVGSLSAVTIAMLEGIADGGSVGEPQGVLVAIVDPVASEGATGLPGGLIVALPIAIGSEENVGSPSSLAVATPASVAASDAVPEILAVLCAAVVEIPSRAAAGTPAAVPLAQLTGVPSGDAVGAPTASYIAFPSTLPSGEVVGWPVVTRRWLQRPSIYRPHVVEISRPRIVKEGPRAVEVFETIHISLAVYIQAMSGTVRRHDIGQLSPRSLRGFVDAGVDLRVGDRVAHAGETLRITSVNTILDRHTAFELERVLAQ